MKLPSFPGPADLLRVGAQGFAAAEQAIALMPRLLGIVKDVEVLIGRVQKLVSEMDRTHQRADAVVTGAAAVTARTDAILARVEPLMDRFEPTLMQLEPTLTRLAETTSPDEVSALVGLVDLLPELVGKMHADILPTLDTLGTVAPDLRDLLDISKELNEMLGSIPGLGRIKRRVDEQQALQDGYRAAEEPPAKPDRHS